MIYLPQLVRPRRDCLADYPTQTPTEWCLDNVIFDEASNHGPATVTGREYIIEPLNDFADRSVSDEVLVSGVQVGKTTILMLGTVWATINDPCGILWVFPNEDTAGSFSRERWMGMLLATQETKKRLPTGADRHDFKTLSQTIGSSLVNFAGSNSPANVASRPCRRVNLDEVDKFNKGVKGEADAATLADQRTKAQTDPQRWKTSTPTVTNGLVWQEFLKGDQRRYFMPCPHCSKHVKLAWSKDFTVFKKTGDEAFITWDKEAKREDDKWDKDRVIKSVRAECPHCGGHIRTHHKTGMVRNGVWRPTYPHSAKGYISRHISSLYSNSPQCSFESLAIEFIQQKESDLGNVQGFVNNQLAEPWESQETISDRIELVSPPDAPPLPDSVTLMTVDAQAVAPYFWVICREWDKEGNSRLAGAYKCDDFETVRRIQEALGVKDNHVTIDSGDNTSTIYRECLRWGKSMGRDRFWVGWTPSKGRERDAKWYDKTTKTHRPWMLGSAAIPSMSLAKLGLFEFNGDWIMDVLNRLRRKQTTMRYEVRDFPCGPEVDGANRLEHEEYWKHCDAKVMKPFAEGRSKRVKWLWVKRSNKWPDHINDCEIMQLAWAMFHRRMRWTTGTEAKVEPAAAN